MSDQKLEIEGVEVYRTEHLDLYADKFRLAARAITLCGHVPVVQCEGRDTVLYAIRPGLIRKATRRMRD